MRKKIIGGCLLVSMLFNCIDVNAYSTIKRMPIDKIEQQSKLQQYSDWEIDLIALVTMAEAEGEPEEGQRLVIDTILNRKDQKYFPDSIYEVVYQPCQFSSMWNGRVNRCFVKNDIRKLVIEEIESRTNNKVVFFRTTRYSDYGVPNIQVGHHYFSSYN